MTSRPSLGGFPVGGFFANERNSLATCADRSGRRRTKKLFTGGGIAGCYSLWRRLPREFSPPGRNRAGRRIRKAAVPPSNAVLHSWGPSPPVAPGQGAIT